MPLAASRAASDVTRECECVVLCMAEKRIG
jgi:hypothetical protein